MKARTLTLALLSGCLSGCLSLAGMGCKNAPGKPQQAEARPEQVLDFPTLYKQNCAACHGVDGQHGAAIALANPAYLMTAGLDNLQHAIDDGRPGTMMPPFGQKAGGMLTEQQVSSLAHGMITTWGGSVQGVTSLPYASHTQGNPAQGQAAYATFCASCHGVNGAGAAGKVGSIVDPAYLALVDDQGLRSLIVAGRPDLGMPDWRSDLPGDHPRAMTDQEVTDLVAWLASFRTTTPGQPYPQQP